MLLLGMTDELLLCLNAIDCMDRPKRVRKIDHNQKSSTFAFRKERASWRAVIQLNIVRSVHVIIDAITHERIDAVSWSLPDHVPVQTDLLKLKMRLAPLLQVEHALTRRLAPEGGFAEEEAILHDREASYADRSHLVREVAINSTCAWKEILGTSSRTSEKNEETPDGHNSSDPSILLNACAQDMQILWNDSTVKTLLKRNNIHMEEVAGFFLDSLERVTALDYIPSDDDVLRARLKTLDLILININFKECRNTGLRSSPNMVGPRLSWHEDSKSNPSLGPARDWRVFDVGGHRSLRSAWIPYFDDMDAIIFLAPVSAFDQKLSEDPSTNRLEDSVNIWNYIAKNELLKHTHLILFMNKIDILKAKLESGIKFSDYVVSYGSRRERENDVKSVTKYLKEKFSGILREKSVISRPFYCHLTTVTNFKSTKEILTRVRDVLMRKHLEDVGLL
ncbi:Guanine nucleotide-binding protein alpha-4 subunit [Termitomyces sp. J132]|nr:Guanine nucleotide-binding protein alpha-4 subunit [Termitomyces sp. J132]